METRGRVLIIAGSDSGGGAGIQADIKTTTALGGFAMTAVTAITAQNTLGVSAVHPVPPDVIAAQIRDVLGDLGADVIKTGMLATRATIEAAHGALLAAGSTHPRVVDPVMVATSGDRLLAADAVEAMKTCFVRGAALLTPNLPEAEVLTGRTIRTLADMQDAIPALRALGAEAVLLKGGHVRGEHIVDLLIEPDHVTPFATPRVPTTSTHGTGCTLASAVATGLGQGLVLRAAVARAVGFVRSAIQSAPRLGRGHGPLNHAHTVAPFPETDWARSASRPPAAPVGPD